MTAQQILTIVLQAVATHVATINANPHANRDFLLRDIVPQWRALMPVAIPDAQGVLRPNIMAARVSKAFRSEVVAGRVPSVIRPIGRYGAYDTMVFSVT